MTTDNHQDQDRIDRLEAAFIDLAESRRQEIAAIQRHDMLLEMAQAIQRDHEQTLQMLTSNQERYEATLERYEAAQERYEATLSGMKRLWSGMKRLRTRSSGLWRP